MMLQVFQNEILEGIVTQHGCEADFGSRIFHVFGDDAGAAEEIDLMIEAQAEGRGLGVAADQGAVGIGIHDRVSDHMNFRAGKRIQNRAELVEGNTLGLHQGVQFVRRKVRRLRFDDVRRGKNDVPWGKQDFPAVTLQRLLLFPGLGRQAALTVLVSLREQVGLDDSDVLNRGRVLIDDDVIHDFQRGEVHGAQILRHEGAEIGLMNVRVSGQARDQDVRLALGVDEVPDVAGVDQVKRPVTHDGLFFAGQWSKHLTQLLRRFDFSRVGLFLLVGQMRGLHVFPSRN